MFDGLSVQIKVKTGENVFGKKGEGSFRKVGIYQVQTVKYDSIREKPLGQVLEGIGRRHRVNMKANKVQLSYAPKVPYYKSLEWKKMKNPEKYADK